MDYKFGTGNIHIPMWTHAYSTSNLDLTAYRLTVYNYDNTGTFEIDGNSWLQYGSYLGLQSQGTGSLPGGTLINNGSMTLTDSTLQVGAIEGRGLIFANRSTIDASSSPTSETILMRSAYLDIGGPGAVNPGMQFLAPIADFDLSDSINLENTHATMEVYFRQSGNFYLFDGAQMVANMHISGPGLPTIYATQITPAFGAPSVNLTTTNPWGHALPRTVIG